MFQMPPGTPVAALASHQQGESSLWLCLYFFLLSLVLLGSSYFPIQNHLLCCSNTQQLALALSVLLLQ